MIAIYRLFDFLGLLLVYGLGVALGWSLCSDIKLRKERRRWIKVGIRRGLRFWANVVIRKQRRESENEIN